MKITKKKTMASLLALFLILIVAVPIIILPVANAHIPPWEIHTYAFITVNPNPIGVGQEAFVMFWLDRVPPGATGNTGDRYRNLKVDVTKPDGKQETLGTFTSDSIGGTYTTYTPDQLGTYTFTVTYPGQVWTSYWPQRYARDRQ